MRKGPQTPRPAHTTVSDVRPPEGYRPHLDGLRMVAVYLVVLFHVGAARFSGGFIGVDVFFVLSGYLVTQLLLREVSTAGGIRFGRFYARRMRRLLPASLVLLAVTAVVHSSLATPAEIGAAADSMRAALLYLANWHFIAESSDYFAAATDRNPVVHFWSLAIEEQFYLVWPLLLAGLFAATRRAGGGGHRIRQVLVVLVAAASAAWALHLVGSRPDRAYYGTDTRAYQLLAGALLALSPGIIARARRRLGLAAAVAGGAVVGLVVLATSLIELDVVERGIAATVSTVVLIVAVEATPDGPVSRVLSLPPIVHLGKISYGTYLWHWPITVFALSLTDGRISPLSAFGIVALLATAMASLSYTMIERPVREQRALDRVPAVVVASGLAIGVLAALVVVPQVLDPSSRTVVAQGLPTGADGAAVPPLDLERAKTDMGPGLDDVDFLPTWSCRDQPSSSCTIVEGSGPHILVIGDSQAWSLFATFATLAQQEDLTLSTAAAAGCPWQRDVFFAETPVEGCRDFKDDLYERVVPDLDPDVVVVVSRNYFDPDGEARATIRGTDGGDAVTGDDGDATFRRRFTEATEQSLDDLTRGGGAVVVVEPVPVLAETDDPFACLTRAETVDECRVTVSPERQQIDAVYGGLASEGRVVVADLDRLVCPALPICDAVVDGEVVRFDRQHVTPRFAATLADPVAELLRGAGLLLR